MSRIICFVLAWAHDSCCQLMSCVAQQLMFAIQDTPLLQSEYTDFNDRLEPPDYIPNGDRDTTKQSPQQKRNVNLSVSPRRSSPLDIIRAPFSKQQEPDTYKDHKSVEEQVFHQQRLEEAELKKKIEDNRVQQVKALEEVRQGSISPEKKSSDEVCSNLCVFVVLQIQKETKRKDIGSCM